MKKDFVWKIVLTRHAGIPELVARYLGRAEYIKDDGRIILYDLDGSPQDSVQVREHLDAEEARELARDGLVLYGVVPLHLAAIANITYAVEWDCPPPRGKEMPADWVLKHGRLVPYIVRQAATCEFCGSVDVEAVGEGVKCHACGKYWD